MIRNLMTLKRTLVAIAKITSASIPAMPRITVSDMSIPVQRRDWPCSPDSLLDEILYEQRSQAEECEEAANVRNGRHKHS